MRQLRRIATLGRLTSHQWPVVVLFWSNLYCASTSAETCMFGLPVKTRTAQLDSVTPIS